MIQKNLKFKIKHYSYPEGQKSHYNSDVINCLKKFEVICCPSAIHGLNPRGSDPFNLKRVMVGFMGAPFPYFDNSLNCQIT